MQKLTIGFVLPYSFDYKGGVQQYTRNLGIALQKLGHQVIYFSPTSSDSLCPSPHYQTGYALNLNSPLGSKTNISFAHLTPSLMQAASQCDIMHYQDILSPYASWKMIKKIHIPTIITLHNGWEGKNIIFSSYLLIIRAQLFKYYSKTITVSNVASKSNYILLKNNSSISPPLDLSQAHINYPMPVTMKKYKKNIVFIGRLNQRKGIVDLVYALRKIPVSFLEETTFHVIGKGNQSHLLTKLVKRFKLENTVIFEGEATNSKKFAFLTHADLAIFPSTHGESFGIVLIEALAAGCPVISGNNNGYKETLKDYPYQQYIVDPKDPNALAGAIISLLNHPDHQKYIKIWAKTFVNKFDSTIIAKKHLQVYRQVLKNIKTSSPARR